VSDELNALAGAYALDALDTDECAVFEEHLTTCQDCADEVRGMQAAAAELSLTTAAAPPPDLRAGVLTAIGKVRPLPPITDNVILLRRARAGRSLWQGLAAACALIAIATSVWGYQQHRDTGRQTSAQVSAVDFLLRAPDAAAITGPVGDGKATLLYSKAEGKAVLVAHGLPAPAAGRTYQLWMISPDNVATSAGTFVPDGSGNAIKDVSGDLTGTVRMGVSVEPAGGSAKPTPGAIIAIMNI
jgi:anti-sigma-K factor RskA